VSAYDEVLRALHASGARFVVVGGTAVVLQGYPRLTVDLDLCLDLDQGPLTAALAALASAGLRPRLPVAAEQFADPERRRSWVEERNLLVFSLYDPDDPRREVDLFATEPVPFDELWRGADVVEIAGVPVRVASVQHLLRMKRLAGRPRDLDDIAALEQLQRDRGGA
jgi:hypothetical protein